METLMYSPSTGSSGAEDLMQLIRAAIGVTRTSAGQSNQMTFRVRVYRREEALGPGLVRRGRDGAPIRLLRLAFLEGAALGGQAAHHEVQLGRPAPDSETEDRIALFGQLGDAGQA